MSMSGGPFTVKEEEKEGANYWEIGFMVAISGNQWRLFSVCLSAGCDKG